MSGERCTECVLHIDTGEHNRYSVRRTLYSVHCTVYNVQYTAYTVHYTLYTALLSTAPHVAGLSTIGAWLDRWSFKRQHLWLRNTPP